MTIPGLQKQPKMGKLIIGSVWPPSKWLTFPLPLRPSVGPMTSRRTTRMRWSSWPTSIGWLTFRTSGSTRPSSPIFRTWPRNSRRDPESFRRPQTHWIPGARQSGPPRRFGQIRSGQSDHSYQPELTLLVQTLLSSKREEDAGEKSATISWRITKTSRPCMIRCCSCTTWHATGCLTRNVS